MQLCGTLLGHGALFFDGGTVFVLGVRPPGDKTILS